MDDAGCFRGEALEACGVEAAVGLRYVAGIDLDSRLVGWRNDLVGALLGGLAGAAGVVADEKRELRAGMPFEKFVDQARAEKAGGTCDQDEFVAVHEIGLRRPER